MDLSKSIDEYKREWFDHVEKEPNNMFTIAEESKCSD